jgi:prepilin-type N-terminal cleavage/methylation domain-containing protein
MMPKIGNKRAFTLLEVMVTTAVLSLGTVLIHESFFITLDSYDYCSNYFNVAPWMDEKIWQVRDNIIRLGSSSQIETSGTFTIKNKDFSWNLSHSLVEGAQDLHKLDLVVFWKEGQRKVKLSRTAYAKYAQS